MNILIKLLILIYVIIAIWSYGLSFSYWQTMYPTAAKNDYFTDMLFSIVSGIIWPIILCIDFLDGEPIGITKLFKKKLKFW